MFITVKPSGAVDRHGIVTPNGTRVHARFKSTLGGLLPERADIIAIAIPSHKYWRGIGMEQGTQEAEIELYRVVKEEEGGHLEVREMCGFPARAVTALKDLV